MKFWIVTPSYNQLEWLKLCVASVRDQVISADGRSALGGGEERIEVNHHVQDANSTDGTVDFLQQYAAGVGERSEDDANSQRIEPSTDPFSPNAQSPEPRASLSGYTFSYASEPDNGMYDAINRGWKLASDDVDIIAHLNCDEQYLPDALNTIASFFEAHTKADIVLADMIVVNSDGSYICHRRSLQPYAFTTRYCVGGFTATTFQRASVTKQKEVFFDTSWKNFGDKVWYNALHKAGCCFAVCNKIVSVFTDTGANLNWTDGGIQERKRYESEFLHGKSIGTTIIAKTLGLRRAMKELILKAPLSYSLYLPGKEQKRSVIPIEIPTGLWHKKWKKS
ncbi:hypothetical protein P4B35_15475 [Pontiellaceae bacterium B12227]|nr:hypothetical protein [Pontiellaceae bacterium B12227]